MAKSKEKRKIKIRAFSYLETVDDPSNPDNSLRVSQTAMRDQEVELEPDQIEKGERFNAFYSDDDESDTGLPEGFDPSIAGEDELIEWIEESNPNASQVIEAAQGDPDTARRLLAAEEAAHGNDARKTVVEGLGAIINRNQ
jgi:hypothetical protein